MNPNSKEIHEDLDKLAKKYQIKKGIVLFEEEYKGKILFRSIIFQPEIKDFSIHKFARMLESCINTSRTFRSIIEHLNTHTFDKLIREDHLIRTMKKAD